MTASFSRLLNTLSLTIGLVAFSSPAAMSYESAFPATDAGTSEIKTLPSGVLLKTSSEGNYFEQGGKLFRPLFRYISSHGISMTVPVEAAIDEAAMYFWVAESEVEKVSGDKDGVSVVRIPERTVAARGGRGSYSKRNFDSVSEELAAWVKARGDLTVTGEPYAVYWNGPFTPWFIKKFEVHLPVQPNPSVSK